MFILSCESTVDVGYDALKERGVSILSYTYSVDGTVYRDLDGQTPEGRDWFYRQLKAGKMPKTSQINYGDYEDYFENLVQHGDVLHIVFSSGLSRSIQNAISAAETVEERHPGRRVAVIDSLCGCGGYGLLVEEAQKQKEAGVDLEQLYSWVDENRHRVHHEFFSTDMKFFKRSGRVSGAAAMLASVLNICPMMRLDAEGRIVAYERVRGKRHAMEATLREMEKHADGGLMYAGRCVVSQADCPEDAEQIKTMIAERFPQIGAITVTDIGAVIASHCGPGTVSVYYFGDKRA